MYPDRLFKNVVKVLFRKWGRVNNSPGRQQVLSFHSEERGYSAGGGWKHKGRLLASGHFWPLVKIWTHRTSQAKMRSICAIPAVFTCPRGGSHTCLPPDDPSCSTGEQSGRFLGDLMRMTPQVRILATHLGFLTLVDPLDVSRAASLIQS